jgi:hypothetical protein
MFLEFITRFLGGVERTVYRAMLWEWPNASSELLSAALSAVDVVIDSGNEPPSAAKHHLVITTTECSDLASLEAFLEADCGALVCGTGRPVGFAMRVLLEKFGIGIPQCPATVGDAERKMSGRPAKPTFTLLELIRRYVNKVGDPAKRVPQKLDKVITALRFHLVALTGRCYEVLEQVATASWKMLDETGGGYVQGTMTVCPTVLHDMVAVLLGEVIPRLNPLFFENMDRSMPFPGLCTLDRASYEIHVDFAEVSWATTGLYLIPGVLATIEIQSAKRGCWVQAGAQTWSNFQRQGPWKRFPVVTVRVPLDETSVVLCSPFGGIIYVGCDQVPFSGFDLKFYDVGRHPIYSGLDEEVQADTFFLSAPWGEIETQFAIFTVPVSMFSCAMTMREMCDQIDLMLRTLLLFLADESAVPYRVVFDVEIGPRGHGVDYPLFFPVDSAESILAATEPSEALFQFLLRIARVSLPRSDLPDEIREGVLVLAVYVAQASIWRDGLEAIISMIHTSSPLWMPFLKIYTESRKTVFPELMSQLRPRLWGCTSGPTMDRLFVKTLSILCEKDMSRDFYGKDGLFSKHRRTTGNGPSGGLVDYTLDTADVSDMAAG